jgi:hypothetical protein
MGVEEREEPSLGSSLLFPCSTDATNNQSENRIDQREIEQQ